jgi:hypothetical protein
VIALLAAAAGLSLCAVSGAILGTFLFREE